MKLLNTLLTLALAFLLLAPGVLAQDQEPPVEVDGSTPARTGKAGPRTKVPVVVPVTGIQPDGVASVVEAVLALEHPLYACPTCKTKSRRKGTCERCGAAGPVEASATSIERAPVDPTKVVERAELQVDRRFLSLTLATHHWGSLAELDRLLEPFEASVKREEFRLPAFSRLHVTGVADEKAAKRLRNGLVDLKVLPAATVLPDPLDETSVWVVPRLGEETVTVGQVTEALSKMRGEPQLDDVQWAAYCSECGTRPTIEMGNPTCAPR